MGIIHGGMLHGGMVQATYGQFAIVSCLFVVLGVFLTLTVQSTWRLVMCIRAERALDALIGELRKYSDTVKRLDKALEEKEDKDA